MSTATTPAMRAATARWMRRRRRLIGYGQWQPFVEAEPVRQHVLALRRQGVAIKTLSEKTGVTVASIDHLVYGKGGYPPGRRIRPESARALLAFQPTLDDYPNGALISSLGSARRMQALAAIGWTVKSIHQHISYVNVATLERIGQAPKITARLARAVRDFYAWASIGTAEDHGVTPRVAARGRRRAEGLGYFAPAWWDDEEFDNPDYEPTVVQTPRYIALAENCLELERQELTRQQIAERLGVTRDGLQRALSEYRKRIGTNDMRKAA